MKKITKNVAIRGTTVSIEFEVTLKGAYVEVVKIAKDMGAISVEPPTYSSGWIAHFRFENILPTQEEIDNIITQIEGVAVAYSF